MNEVQQAVDVLFGAVLRLLQEDGHRWSNRHCATCQAVSAIVGKPFGCVEYAAQLKKTLRDRDIAIGIERNQAQEPIKTT